MSKEVELETPSVLTVYVPVKHGSTYIKNTNFYQTVQRQTPILT